MVIKRALLEPIAFYFNRDETFIIEEPSTGNSWSDKNHSLSLFYGSKEQDQSLNTLVLPVPYLEFNNPVHKRPFPYLFAHYLRRNVPCLCRHSCVWKWCLQWTMVPSRAAEPMKVLPTRTIRKLFSRHAVIFRIEQGFELWNFVCSVFLVLGGGVAHSKWWNRAATIPG